MEVTYPCVSGYLRVDEDEKCCAKFGKSMQSLAFELISVPRIVRLRRNSRSNFNASWLLYQSLGSMRTLSTGSILSVNAISIPLNSSTLGSMSVRRILQKPPMHLVSVVLP